MLQTRRLISLCSDVPVLAVLAMLASSAAQAAPAEPCYTRDWSRMDRVRGTVVRTVDGDTARIKVDGLEYSVRFQFIDTPETNYQGKSQGIWGERAHENLDKLLPPKAAVTLQFHKGERCDRYGRLLATVWRGSVNVNLQQVAEAYAVNYCIAPNDCPEYIQAAQSSITQKRGIFSSPSLKLPYVWRLEVSNRDYDKYVGNMLTKKVYRPESINKVPVANRVFFMNAQDIRAPYELIE